MGESKGCGVLAFLGQQPRYRSAEESQGQLLYLLRSGQVVVPDERGAHGWSCLVVCGPGGEPVRGRRGVSDVEIETALRVRPPDPVRDMDLMMFATVWQTRVWERWPGGAMPVVAAMLAEQLVDQASHIVVLNRAVVGRVRERADLGPHGLGRALGRLVGHGLLTPVSHDPISNTGRFVVLLPDRRVAVPSHSVAAALSG
jgi:hypothetical protein